MTHFDRTDSNADSPRPSSSDPTVGKLAGIDGVWWVFLGSIALLVPLATLELNRYDEAIRLVGAEQVRMGKRPYHDFYAIYGPAQFYGYAFLFNLFGPTVLLARTVLVVTNAATASLIHAMIRQSGASATTAMIGSLAFLLPRHGSGDLLYLVDPSVTLWLAAGLLLAQNHARALLGAGLLLGVGSLYRHDFGGYGLIAALGACFLRPPAGDGRWRSCLRLSSGFVLVALLGYGPLLINDASAVIRNLLVYPATQLPYRRLPYPLAFVVDEWLVGLRTMTQPRGGLLGTLVRWAPLAVFTVPMGLVASAIAFARGGRLGNGRSDGADRMLLFLMALVLLSTPYAFGRCDFAHLMPLYVLLCAALPILFGRQVDRTAPLGSNRRFEFVPAGGLAAWLVCLTLSDWSAFARGHWVGLPRAAGIVCREPEPWLAKAARQILDQVDGERSGNDAPVLFVGCDFHDRIFVNSLGLYFLTGTQPATGWYHFDPGITNTRPVQLAIIDDLRQTEFAVLTRLDYLEEPNSSRVSSGVRILDEFLATEFSLLRIENEYRILRRRPTDRPRRGRRIDTFIGITLEASQLPPGDANSRPRVQDNASIPSEPTRHQDVEVPG